MAGFTAAVIYHLGERLDVLFCVSSMSSSDNFRKKENYVPNVMIDRAFKLPLTRKNCQASGETGLKADKEK